MGAPTTTTLKKPVAASEPLTSCATYLSLIQQYLAVFQVDNAVWLAERCVAEYPDNQEAAYLQALCYYRNGKPKNARHCLSQQTVPSTAMLFLMAQCSYELGDYSCGETSLRKEAATAYKQSREAATMTEDEWILQTTVRFKTNYCMPFAAFLALMLVLLHPYRKLNFTNFLPIYIYYN